MKTVVFDVVVALIVADIVIIVRAVQRINDAHRFRAQTVRVRYPFSDRHR